MNSIALQNPAEWLEADGLGGFASGTASGLRTRRYHSLLLTASTPPTGRLVLVNGFDAWVETPNGRWMISTQNYAPGVRGGDGAERIEGFGWEPWPHWIFKLGDGTRIEFELFVPKGQPMVCLSWKSLGPRRDIRLSVRPFLSGRDYHALQKCNPAFVFDATVREDRVSWQPYAGVPGVVAITNGRYAGDPHWYHNFTYDEERARGLDSEEDLAAPGVFSWNLDGGEAALIFSTQSHLEASLPAVVRPTELLRRLRDAEKRRRTALATPLDRAADAYLVRRSAQIPLTQPAPATFAPADGLETIEGRTIIAGYPWFTDWGRDTLIALRGLCVATGRLQEARDILLAWSSTVSLGMLPNRFPDHGGQAEFNAVDASLWFVIAVHEYLAAVELAQARPLARHGHRGAGPSPGATMFERPSVPNPAEAAATQARLLSACDAILEGYSAGTRYGIRADQDGLLACGEAGVQLTWMDAKVGDWVVTPRIGKPVEVQALWLNALALQGRRSAGWNKIFEAGLASFRQRFWNEAGRCLFDVIDVNHEPGAVDPAFRPNQILAVGGLPLALLAGEPARLIVEAVEDRLWTPMGLRSLAPGEPGYAPRYEGGVRPRDGAYHQGTVWPWLIGPFVEAWLRVHGGSPANRRAARGRFVDPLLRHLHEAGLGHVSEIADAESPHTPRGCPWQAWSVGELLRLDRVVLAEPPMESMPAKRPPPAGGRTARPRRKFAPAEGVGRRDAVRDPHFS